MDSNSNVALTIILVANAVAVVVASRLTLRNGRGVWPGLLLGAFLGWFGVLIAWFLVSRSPAAATAPRSAAVRSTAAEAPVPTRSAVVGLDHVQVAAPPDREFDARRFYGGLIGLTEVDKPPLLRDRGGVWFAVGAQQLHVGVAADGFVAATKAHPALRLQGPAEVRELAEKLDAAGYEVAWADELELPGAIRFHVGDPFGNRIEFIATL
jgi:catechol 2,3-dioxygenase-like lactoylglutathione lyase family enzyme